MVAADEFGDEFDAGDGEVVADAGPHGQAGGGDDGVAGGDGFKDTDDGDAVGFEADGVGGGVHRGDALGADEREAEAGESAGGDGEFAAGDVGGVGVDGERDAGGRGVAGEAEFDEADGLVGLGDDADLGAGEKREGAGGLAERGASGVGGEFLEEFGGFEERGGQGGDVEGRAAAVAEVEAVGEGLADVLDGEGETGGVFGVGTDEDGAGFTAGEGEFETALRREDTLGEGGEGDLGAGGGAQVAGLGDDDGVGRQRDVGEEGAAQEDGGERPLPEGEAAGEGAEGEGGEDAADGGFGGDDLAEGKGRDGRGGFLDEGGDEQR